MTDSIEAARRSYVEELRFRTQMSYPPLLEAFETVPRERFLGPGPWRYRAFDIWTTEDDDPRHVYHDALFVLDEAKKINNGQPSLWAYHLDRLRIRTGDRVLHLGCGTGYYTAILAELVGADGAVIAIDIEEALVERARAALVPWPQVTVLHADGAVGPFEPADAIIASAGATHPLPAWIAALKPGGKLLFPLTSSKGPGTMAYVTRSGESILEARLVSSAGFIDFQGARDPDVNTQLAEALKRDQGKSVRSMRCDTHEKDETCWLHGDSWCFSTRDPVQEESAAL
jgi:protein-L-isoaspartate(D-aspartate) O-methyltransferase